MFHSLNNALQRQIDPPKWRVTHFRNPHVNLDGRRFAVTRSLTPLCIGEIETPDRSALLPGDDASRQQCWPRSGNTQHCPSRWNTVAIRGMVDLR